MIPNFQIALLKLLKWEGGKSNDPDDPGGRTNFGITEKSWEGFRPHEFKLDLFDITEVDAGEFYLRQFWIPMRLAGLKSQALADTLLSFGVNQGAKTVIRRLQRVLGVTQDGVMGPVTFKRMDLFNPDVLNGLFLNATVEFYNRLINHRPSLAKFEKGWKARVVDYRVVRRDA